MASSVLVIASRTRTHSTLTVQRAERSHGRGAPRSSEAQIIGAIGPSRARRTSLIRIWSGGRGELVAAAGAAGGDDEAGVPEARHELLQVGARQVLVRGDLREAGRPGAVAAPELDHEPDAVLALRGEGDGAGSMEARAVRQGSILVGRVGSRERGAGAAGGIPTDFVGISLAHGPDAGQASRSPRATTKVQPKPAADRHRG